MTKSLRLNPAFKELLTNLVSVNGEHQPGTAEACRQLFSDWLLAHPGEYALLRPELERVLSDRSYLRLHLRHLDKLRLRDLPDELLSDERKGQVLAEGLNALTLGEIGLLALHPHQLLDLWDAIGIGEELSPYWSDAVDRAMEQAAQETDTKRRPISEIVASALQRAGLDLETGRSNPTPAAGTEFGPASPASLGVTIPLTSVPIYMGQTPCAFAWGPSGQSLSEAPGEVQWGRGSLLEGYNPDELNERLPWASPEIRISIPSDTSGISVGQYAAKIMTKATITDRRGTVRIVLKFTDDKTYDIVLSAAQPKANRTVPPGQLLRSIHVTLE